MDKGETWTIKTEYKVRLCVKLHTHYTLHIKDIFISIFVDDVRSDFFPESSNNGLLFLEVCFFQGMCFPIWYYARNGCLLPTGSFCFQFDSNFHALDMLGMETLVILVKIIACL